MHHNSKLLRSENQRTEATVQQERLVSTGKFKDRLWNTTAESICLNSIGRAGVLHSGHTLKYCSIFVLDALHGRFIVKKSIPL